MHAGGATNLFPHNLTIWSDILATRRIWVSGKRLVAAFFFLCSQIGCVRHEAAASQHLNTFVRVKHRCRLWDREVLKFIFILASCVTAENGYNRLWCLVHTTVLRPSLFKVAVHGVIAYEMQGSIAGIFMATDICSLVLDHNIAGYNLFFACGFEISFIHLTRSYRNHCCYQGHNLPLISSFGCVFMKS